MKHPDGVDRELPQRLLGAERHVRVRMRAVDDLHERAIGNRRWHVANLDEPRETELADAVEIRDVEPRANHAVGKERQGLPRVLRQRRYREYRRVGGHVGLEMRAEAGKGRIHVDGRQVAGAFVHHVARDGGQPFVPFEIGGRTARAAPA